jgi:hypothetical protein
VTSNGHRPACARCGGTGYVYLWSVAPAGARLWFCDRSSCKRFWSYDGWIGNAVASGGATLHAVPPLVSSVDERVLQPA